MVVPQLVELDYVTFFFNEHTNFSSKLKKIGKTQLVQKLKERKQSFELKWVDAFTHW